MVKIKHTVIAMLDELDEIYSYHHVKHKKSDNCMWCEMVRLRKLQEDFIYRFEHCGIDSPRLSLWSLGSSMKDTPYNRKILYRDWTKLRQHLNKYTSWIPAFRVVEVGRRGLIHIHFVSLAWIDHSTILTKWREIRGESANVHVSGSDSTRDARKLIKYLTKYLTKQNTRYAFMGPLRAISGERKKEVSKDVPKLKYGGVCYGGFRSTIRTIPNAQRNLLADKNNSETLPRR